MRELRRLARDAGVSDQVAAVLLEIAYAAGLLAATEPAGRNCEQRWLPTVAYDTWREAPLPQRWALLARTWLDMPRAPSMVGQRDEKDRLINALSDQTDRLRREHRPAGGARRAGRPAAGTGGRRRPVLGRLAWRAPRRPGGATASVRRPGPGRARRGGGAGRDRARRADRVRPACCSPRTGADPMATRWACAPAPGADELLAALAAAAAAARRSRVGAGRPDGRRPRPARAGAGRRAGPGRRGGVARRRERLPGDRRRACAGRSTPVTPPATCTHCSTAAPARRCRRRCSTSSTTLPAATAGCAPGPPAPTCAVTTRPWSPRCSPTAG